MSAPAERAKAKALGLPRYFTGKPCVRGHTAEEEKEIADTISGIAQDGTAKELQQMRELRQQIKAEARISRELAGTDTRAQEAEFLE